MSDWPKDGVTGVMSAGSVETGGGNHEMAWVFDADDALPAKYGADEIPVVIRTAEQDAARSAVIEAAREVLWAFDEAWGDNAHRTMGALRATLEQTEGGE